MQMSEEKALSHFLSYFLSLSLSAALIPRQVLQCACSVGSSCLIVCYYFNTYIMYFIKICCQSLSVPLHPITQGSPPLIYLFLFIYFCCHHLPSLVCLSFTARNSIILAVVLWCCHDTQWRIHYLISFLACLDSSIRFVFRKVLPSVFCFAKCAQSEDFSLFLLIKWKGKDDMNKQAFERWQNKTVISILFSQARIKQRWASDESVYYSLICVRVE